MTDVFGAVLSEGGQACIVERAGVDGRTWWKWMFVTATAVLFGRSFDRRVSEIERRLDRLLARPVKTPAAQALLKRQRKYRAHLLVVLHVPAVPPHNNAAERVLRPSVVPRKVTGGFRSAWGAHAYAALASVIDTAKLRGQSVFDTLVTLMGHPVLPYLTAPDA